MMASGTGKKIGRPPKVRGQRVPYDVVDRLLVEGELVQGPEGKELRVWPTQRDVARRYGVSPGLIGMFAKQQKTVERRAAFQAGQPIAPISITEPAPEPSAEADKGAKTGRRAGRPRKAEAPIIAIEELDRFLVYGEVVQTPDGAQTTVYPTYKQLAERYGVATSYIGSYAKHHNVLRRREDAKVRLALKVDEKLLEKRAEAIAVGKDDVVRLIDKFLMEFVKLLEEGRVRCDNPTDVNTFVRLKEFILGGADSRQEVHAVLSLESIQQRYARMLQNQRSDPALSGMVSVLASGQEVSALDTGNGLGKPTISPERSLAEIVISPVPSERASAEQWENTGDCAPRPLAHFSLTELKTVLELARKLSEQMGAEEADDEELLEVRLLRAIEPLEARLDALCRADVAPRDADDEEDEP